METAETASWDQYLDLKSRFLTNESLRKTRARIFKLLQSPGIDSKELFRQPMLPGRLVQRTARQHRLEESILWTSQKFKNSGYV
jgi:hypothetical protein